MIYNKYNCIYNLIIIYIALSLTNKKQDLISTHPYFNQNLHHIPFPPLKSIMASRIPGSGSIALGMVSFPENTWEFQPSKNHMHILLLIFAKYISHAWKCSMTAQSVHSMIKTNIKKYCPGNLKYTRFLSKHLQTPKRTMHLTNHAVPVASR